MGRMNRSRKRRDEMNKVKRQRNAAKELTRLKKTLGLIDADGNEIMKEVADIATVKSAAEIQKKRQKEEEREILEEITHTEDSGEVVEVVNEKTGKKHKYNLKTMKDQYGSYPPWYKPRNTARKQRKRDYARKMSFKQAWTTINVPL